MSLSKPVKVHVTAAEITRAFQSDGEFMLKVFLAMEGRKKAIFEEIKEAHPGHEVYEEIPAFLKELSDIIEKAGKP